MKTTNIFRKTSFALVFIVMSTVFSNVTAQSHNVKCPSCNYYQRPADAKNVVNTGCVCESCRTKDKKEREAKQAEDKRRQALKIAENQRKAKEEAERKKLEQEKNKPTEVVIAGPKSSKSDTKKATITSNGQAKATKERLKVVDDTDYFAGDRRNPNYEMNLINKDDKVILSTKNVILFDFPDYFNGFYYTPKDKNLIDDVYYVKANNHNWADIMNSNGDRYFNRNDVNQIRYCGKNYFLLASVDDDDKSIKYIVYDFKNQKEYINTLKLKYYDNRLVSGHLPHLHSVPESVSNIDKINEKGQDNMLLLTHDGVYFDLRDKKFKSIHN